MSNSTNGNLLKIANRVLKIGGRVLTQPKSSFPEVKIGSQIWMSKNLAIDDGGDGIYTQTVNYGQGDVVEYYYNWAAAMNIAESIEGWHLPTEDEWKTLRDTIGSVFAGADLKSTYGWSEGNGNDTYGFAAFPAGRYSGGSFYNIGSRACFWTSSTSLLTQKYCRYFDTGASMSGTIYSQSQGLSVRLIKDSE